jgi:hypothetical protein
MTKTTLYNWRLGYKFGGTRYPAGWRLHALAEALGFPYVPVAIPAGQNSLRNAEVFDDLDVHEHKPKHRQKLVAKTEQAAPIVVYHKAARPGRKAVKGRKTGAIKLLTRPATRAA